MFIISGAQLKEIIKERGYSHEEVAKAVGTNRQIISSWCNMNMLDDDIMFRLYAVFSSEIKLMEKNVSLHRENINYRNQIENLKSQIKLKDQMIKDKDLIIHLLNKKLN